MQREQMQREQMQREQMQQKNDITESSFIDDSKTIHIVDDVKKTEEKNVRFDDTVGDNISENVVTGDIVYNNIEEEPLVYISPPTDEFFGGMVDIE